MSGFCEPEGLIMERIFAHSTSFLNSVGMLQEFEIWNWKTISKTTVPVSVLWPINETVILIGWPPIPNTDTYFEDCARILGEPVQSSLHCVLFGHHAPQNFSYSFCPTNGNSISLFVGGCRQSGERIKFLHSISIHSPVEIPALSQNVLAVFVIHQGNNAHALLFLSWESHQNDFAFESIKHAVRWRQRTCR